MNTRPCRHVQQQLVALEDMCMHMVGCIDLIHQGHRALHETHSNLHDGSSMLSASHARKRHSTAQAAHLLTCPPLPRKATTPRSFADAAAGTETLSRLRLRRSRHNLRFMGCTGCCASRITSWPRLRHTPSPPMPVTPLSSAQCVQFQQTWTPQAWRPAAALGEAPRRVTCHPLIKL